jgi:hypothetical protein
MPTYRNPSFSLTDAQVDDIVDRLLLGKYEKHRPAKQIEVIRAGLLTHSTCNNYVTSRWGVRPRYSHDPKAGLSGAGVTMRTNKLWERAEVHLRNTNNIAEADEIVWKVIDDRTFDTVCFATGSREGARNWAFTLFGWTLREGCRIEELRCHLAGAGGAQAASMMNLSRLNEISNAIKGCELKIAEMNQRMDKLRIIHDTVASVAAYGN